jgi:hypothetical protein
MGLAPICRRMKSRLFGIAASLVNLSIQAAMQWQGEGHQLKHSRLPSTAPDLWNCAKAMGLYVPLDRRCLPPFHTG